MTSPETEIEDQGQATPDEPKLTLEVQVDKPSTCERRVSVTVSREDVDRYFDKAFTEMMPSANVPGFRAGRAPRKLVEQMFRDQLSDQVKGSLLMDAMTQISEEQDFSAISEPDFDFDAIDLPEKGPLKFEFKLEVRPEFDMPKWKGLKLEKLERDFDKKDVDRRLQEILEDDAELTPSESPVEVYDFLVANLKAKHNGKTLAHADEVLFQARPVLSFPEGRLEGFDKLVKGKKAGDKFTGEVMISHDASAVDLQGEKVDVEFEILDVKKMTIPELDADQLSRLGGFENEGELRDRIKEELQRRMEYQQQRRIRQQITSLLTQSADWDLPPDLVRRQADREVERATLEMRSSGFSEDEIRAYEHELRQNSLASTRKALQEHFILERIAEDENLEADPQDYEVEIAQIAYQSREPVRRVRARIEKRGLMDALRNQIIERKVIELIKDQAEFKGVKYEPETNDTEPVDLSLTGSEGSQSIPSAKYSDGEAKEIQQPVDRE